MGFSKKDTTRNACMLTGKFRKQGYDWWWHSFTGRNAKTGEEKPFFIEFFLCNPDLAEPEPILGQLPENKRKGKKPSYLMVKAGTWGEGAKQLHRFFSWKDIDINFGVPFSIKAEDCFVSEKELFGSVSLTKEEVEKHPEYMCEAGSMSWELQIEKKIPYNVGYGASKPLRTIKAFEMYWHAEGMKSEYKGKVNLDGEEYEILPDTCFGYADKNWGSNFTTPWVWLSSNDLKSKISGERLTNSVFDIGGGKPKVFFVSLDRKLLSAFYYEGKEYEFNFSKFWTFTRTKFDCKETETEIVWHIRQETLKAIMETEVHCLKKDMLFVNYEAPDGMKRHNRLWNGGNGTGTITLYEKKGREKILVDIVEAGHIGCEYGEMD